MEKLPLSLVFITLNEEENIGRAIQSVPFASEILVLDSGSKDATQKIAAGLGAKIVEEPWRGFGRQKQRAAELAKYDWVLALDADEALSPELRQEIVNVFKHDPKTWAFEFPRKSYYWGRWISHGGWYPDWQRRLFNKKHATWTADILHERVKCSGPVGKLKAPLLHYPFKNLAAQVQTNNRYSTLGAEILHVKGKRSTIFHLIFKPIHKFIDLYFLRRGFLDGLPGLIIGLGAAYSVFLKYAKLMELKYKKA